MDFKKSIDPANGMYDIIITRWIWAESQPPFW
jgi:hypothetical protein